jgi:hypothetical protein
MRRLDALAAVGGLVAAMIAACAPVDATRSTAAATGTVVAGRADADMVGDLAALCGVPPGDPNAAEAASFCHGYLAAVGDYHAALHPSGARPGALFCPPSPPPSVEQATASFVAWARANPQHQRERTVDGVVRWARSAYPCPAAPAVPPARRGRRG